MKTTSTTDGQPTVTWVLEARFKELTDEEIIDLINKHIDYVPDEDGGMKLIGVMEFARAILKKSQEK